MKLFSDNKVSVEEAAALLTSPRAEAIASNFYRTEYVTHNPGQALWDFFDHAAINGYPTKYALTPDMTLTMSVGWKHYRTHNVIQINDSFFKVHITSNYELRITAVDLHETLMMETLVDFGENAVYKYHLENKIKSAFIDFKRRNRITSLCIRILETFKPEFSIVTNHYDKFVNSLEFCHVLEVEINDYLMSTSEGSIFKLNIYDTSGYKNLLIISMQTIQEDFELEVQPVGTEVCMVWDGEKGKWDRLF